MTEEFPIVDLDDRLHDAEIETESVRLANGTLTCRGALFDLERRRTVRRHFELRIDHVNAFEIVDQAKVGVIPVESVTQQSTGIVEFVGAIPVRLVVMTYATTCCLLTNDS